MTEDEKTGKVLTHDEVGTVLLRLITYDNALRAEIEEWEQSFNLYDRAIRALTAYWHKHNPDAEPLTLPDTGKLCAWIVKELESKDAEIERLKAVSEAVQALDEKWCDSYGGELPKELRAGIRARRDRTSPRGLPNSPAVAGLKAAKIKWSKSHED